MPLFSVLTTVFDPEPEHLSACLSSVDAQTSSDWEHLVVDDCSTRAEISELLSRNLNQRRTIIQRAINGGIAVASNEALLASSGDYVVLLDHDDVLDPEALERIAGAIEKFAPLGAPDVLYSDHDLLRSDGRYTSPMYKPVYSPIRLTNQNYITHLVVIRRAAMQEVGGWRTGFDGAQDHDLLLRLADQKRRFVRLPGVLLHWRQSPRSVASSSDNKPEAWKRGVAAVKGHLDRQGIDASVSAGEIPGTYRIRRKIVGHPRVSIVIPTRGSTGRVWGGERIFVHDAVQSVLDAASAAEFEVVVVLDVGTDPLIERGLRRIAGDALVTVEVEGPFNFADKINRGVAASSGSHLLLLNDDTELVAADSVDEMLGLTQLPDVGMVGAKLLYADGRLQHGGHVYNGQISHALLGWRGDHPGPNRMLAVERECGGVTAAAALLRREVFDDVGGMDASFAANYNDVDLSLSIRATGRSVVWTPHACWFHFEQQSFAHPIDKDEITRIQHRWGKAVAEDPYYNPNLAPNRCDWLERPLHSGAPPYELLPDGRISWG